MSRFRNFCFTINNYLEEDLKSLECLNTKYLVFGFEKGESGTDHIQGYAELNNAIRFETLKCKLPRAHIEMRKGTAKQASDYCKKEGNFKETGSMSAPGRRSDLDSVRSIAEEEGLRVVSSLCSSQQIRVAEKYLSYNEHERSFKPRVIYIYGKSGIGKSKLARELYPDEDYYTKNDGTKWWDGYDKHKICVIDDFRDSWWTITYFLGLIDRYPFRLEIKGGYRQFLSEVIIITSIKHPSELYRNCGEHNHQIIRRIDQIIDLNSDTNVTEVGGNTMPLPGM